MGSRAAVRGGGPLAHVNSGGARRSLCSASTASVRCRSLVGSRGPRRESRRADLVPRSAARRHKAADGVVRSADAAPDLQVPVGEARLGRLGRLGGIGRARDGGDFRLRRDERAGAAEGEGGDDGLHLEDLRPRKCKLRSGLAKSGAAVCPCVFAARASTRGTTAIRIVSYESYDADLCGRSYKNTEAMLGTA